MTHNDVKGSNLPLGFGKGGEEQVWLVGFGLASRYSVKRYLKDYKPDKSKSIGTVEFMSRNAQNGGN